MISLKLMLYCLAVGSLYLIVITLLLDFLERWLHLKAGIPADMIESTGLSWSVMNFMMDALFFVAVPTVAYSFLYFLIPLSGVKAGMAAALFAFTLGAAPGMMGLSVRIKLPMPYLLFLLLSVLVKLSGTLIIIAYLYSL